MEAEVVDIVQEINTLLKYYKTQYCYVTYRPSTEEEEEVDIHTLSSDLI